MSRPVNQPDLVSSAESTFADYAQVCAGPQRLGKTANKHLVVHANSKPPARHPRFGHFENRRSDLPALSDQRIIYCQPFRCEVFAKLAVLERSAKLPFPPACVFNGICVNRFINASVRFAIRLFVAVEIYSSRTDASGDR